MELALIFHKFIFHVRPYRNNHISTFRLCIKVLWLLLANNRSKTLGFTNLFNYIKSVGGGYPNKVSLTRLVCQPEGKGLILVDPAHCPDPRVWCRWKGADLLSLLVCSSVVRELVCQPSGLGSNPGGIVQSQLVQGEKPIKLLPTFTF